MLLDLGELVQRYELSVDGVLHAGAHLGEEAAEYQRLGVGNVWWIEANPAVLPKLRDHLRSFGQPVIHALLWDEDGVDLPFNVTNYDGMSSSVLDFGTHPNFSPDTVFVDQIKMTSSTIDTIVTDHGIHANFLNMDLQGVEGNVLRGATKFLAGVDYVMTEVNNAQVYVGCTQIDEIDEILKDFRRVETYWVPGQGWGDAFYIRNGVR